MLYVAATMSPGNVRVVLHRPSDADNLGATARVLKNFGLARLGVVASPAWEGLPREAGFATELVYGALRYRSFLEGELESELSGQTVTRIEAFVEMLAEGRAA